MDTEQLFREKLLEHYHNPRNVGTVQEPDFSAAEYNHSCGDQVQIEGRIEDGIIRSLAFVGSGCILSQAVASMVTEACKDKTVQEVLALNKEFVLGLIGSTLGPTRLRCALLSLYALQHGLRAYLNQDSE
jgi:nitrogen fixation NifU-like protein